MNIIHYNPLFCCRLILSLNYYTGITVGFERISYTFSEERSNLGVQDEVFIIKQNSQTSELTYDITVESFSGTALNSIDFQAAAEIDEDFTPMFQRIPVNFTIFPDDAPEGIETFTFQLRNSDPYITFTNDPRETTIFIFDIDGECCMYTASHGLHGRPQCMCSK